MLKDIGVMFAVFLSVTGAAAAAAAADSDQDRSDVTIFRGNFRTMDDSWPTCNYVAVQSGKILSVGTFPDIRRQLEVMDVNYTVDETFKDKYVFPGFIEPHTHPFGGGFAMMQNILSTLKVGNPYGPDKPTIDINTIEDAMEELKRLVNISETQGSNETILTWGYDTVALEGYLNSTQLDEVSEEIPVVVWDASEHFVFINTPAIEQYYDHATMKDVVGVQFADAGKTKSNGQFLGTNAMLMIVGQILQEKLKADKDIYAKSLRYMVDLSRLHGVTTTQEMTVGASLSDPMAEAKNMLDFFNSEDVPMRCQGVLDGRSLLAYFEKKIMDTTADKKAIFELALAYSYKLVKESTDKMFFGDAVKFFADDAFLSLGMVMENPGYYDGRKGLFITDPDVMIENWMDWWKAGKQIHVHANGNGGTKATLEAVEYLQEHFPRNDHRFCFQHNGITTPEMAPRVKSVGAIVSTNPFYVYGRSEFNAKYIGAERAYTAARMRTLVDAGVKVSMHFDSPVAPPVPLTGVWIAVNRYGYSETLVRGPGERVSVHEAFKMVTINAAHSLFLEDKLGSIAVGKFADFAVLNEDPYMVPKECIRDVEVWGTVVGGKIYPASEICKDEPFPEDCPGPKGKSAMQCRLSMIKKPVETGIEPDYSGVVEAGGDSDVGVGSPSLAKLK